MLRNGEPFQQEGKNMENERRDMELSGRDQLVLAVVGTVSWADFYNGFLHTIEDNLRLAVEATVDEYRAWGDDEDEHWINEYELSPEQVQNLSPELKLGYVGRLLVPAVGIYGLEIEEPYEEDFVGRRPHTPAALLRALCNIMGSRTHEGPGGQCRGRSARLEE